MSADTTVLGVNEKKHRVAKHLIQQAATLVEFWGEMGDPEIDSEFARTCIARWLEDLPGRDWDQRLNEPRPAPPDPNGES
ncbi:hypothetical protein [Streptomyces sp. AC1-42T]|uniref:hypothetical protein n=1 Tax=Streptomyces sp. AC1-42T TaxID=2218665 RepID=UPI000DAED717|nr:hypothetical protein [Streptomyces sp. AC1-42T]PZT71568.1 hypothetical protein DNK55_33225 [Streptomyces sp. AC1-42T]